MKSARASVDTPRAQFLNESRFSDTWFANC